MLFTLYVHSLCAHRLPSLALGADRTMNPVSTVIELPVLFRHFVAFMTALNVEQIISNTKTLELVQF